MSSPTTTSSILINGGGFAIEWFADDSWIEGTGNPSGPQPTGVNYDSLSTLLAGDHEVLGNFTYTTAETMCLLIWTLDLTDGFLADAEGMGDPEFPLYSSAGAQASVQRARSFCQQSSLISVTAVQAGVFADRLRPGLATGGMAAFPAGMKRLPHAHRVAA